MRNHHVFLACLAAVAASLTTGCSSTIRSDGDPSANDVDAIELAPEGDDANSGAGGSDNPTAGDPANPGAGDPADPGAGDPADPGAGDPADPGAGDPADPGAGDPGDPGAGDPADPGAGDPAAPGVCYGDLVPAAFDFPLDGASCSGPTFVRYSAEQGLWVGVVSCGDGAVRLYLSDSDAGPFYPAADLAGAGADHCELLVQGFTLAIEDLIDSGNCPNCSMNAFTPISFAPAYARHVLGEPFFFVPETTEWNYYASPVNCGCGAPEAAL
jgi:hypothetical protein